MPDHPQSFFSEKSKRLYNLYCKVSLEIIASNLGCDDFVFSELAFGKALYDSDVDISAMKSRRLDKISRCKAAGILLFRLSRTSVIHIPQKMALNQSALSLNHIAALAFVLSRIAGLSLHSIDKINPSLLLELQFTLEKRHMNQEALAICIEAIRSAVEK